MSKTRKRKSSRKSRATTSANPKQDGQRRARKSRKPRKARERQPGPKRQRRRTRGSRRLIRRIVPSNWWPSRRWRVIGIVVVALVSAGLGAATTLYVGMSWFELRAPPALNDEPPVAVSWPDGLGARESAALLRDLGLTDYPAAMEVYLNALDIPACAVPGPHLLPRGATPGALAAALCRSDKRPKVRVTIPEGFHRFSIGRRLASKGVCQLDAFAVASADREFLYALGIEPAEIAIADSAEGFLFPATYELRIDSEPKAIVKRMVEESQRRWKRLIKKHPGGWERLQAEYSMNHRDVINLAAMVEKEAAVADERPLIASVFLNRLKSDAYPHLQSDPTAMYGCVAMAANIPACKDWNGRASGAINRDKKNVFSTYVTRGLPPGPIGNPGEGSMEAVLSPTRSDYYFFVAKGGGRHEFTSTYAAHLEAVKRLRRRK